MEEYHQITLDEWKAWKEDIRQKLAETAQNFVYIGYRLKQIRDSGMYGGASDVFEFAKNEYGLGKSTVSRFIAINEKYSKEGNSLELRDEYKGFSSSKLSEMLTLPDSECELITEKTTVKDIRELKSFDRQQPDIHSEDNVIGIKDPLDFCIDDYFKDKKEMLNETLDHAFHGRWKEAAECMNASGSATHNKGLCFLFMYEFEKGIKYKLITKPMPISMDWQEFLASHVLLLYAKALDMDHEDPYTAYYGAEVVATSQQEEPQPQEPQQPELIVENENPVNEPLSEEEEIEEPVNEMDEPTSEEVENEEEPINTEEENTENAESQELQNSEPVATSQREEEKPEEEIKNRAAFQNAKDALIRAKESFDKGEYKRAMDMADAFIFHLERALK